MAGGRGREIGGRLWTSGIWAQSENKPELREREKRKGKGFQILKANNQMNPNTNLNSNTQKQCTSMYATLNSYDSYILF
jgi:hypothetical protein